MDLGSFKINKNSQISLFFNYWFLGEKMLLLLNFSPTDSFWNISKISENFQKLFPISRHFLSHVSGKLEGSCWYEAQNVCCQCRANLSKTLSFLQSVFHTEWTNFVKISASYLLFFNMHGLLGANINILSCILSYKLDLVAYRQACFAPGGIFKRDRIQFVPSTQDFENICEN